MKGRGFTVREQRVQRLAGTETCCVPAASIQSTAKLIRPDGELQITAISQSKGVSAASLWVCVYVRATSLKITYAKDCSGVQQNPRKEHQETSLGTALRQSAKLFITSSYVIWSQIKMRPQAFNPGDCMWIPLPTSPPKLTSPCIPSLTVTAVAFGMMILLGLKSPTLHLVFEPGSSQYRWNILVCSSRPIGKSHHMPCSVPRLSKSYI